MNEKNNLNKEKGCPLRTMWVRFLDNYYRKPPYGTSRRNAQYRVETTRSRSSEQDTSTEKWS